jgi:hypothetical protein
MTMFIGTTKKKNDKNIGKTKTSEIFEKDYVENQVLERSLLPMMNEKTLQAILRANAGEGNIKRVSFELAHLLKIKFFHEKENAYYIHWNDNYNELKTEDIESSDWNSGNENIYSAPTYLEVGIWLFIKYNIFVFINTVHEKMRDVNAYQPNIAVKGGKPYSCEFYEDKCDAYEAAFKYCLTKLVSLA